MSMPLSPTAEGFRLTFRRPSLALAEITWRWAVGGTALALFFFALFEYLATLPVSNGELLLLRTRNPYLVGRAISHIFQGTLSRVAFAAVLAGLLLTLLWVVAASLGRMATVRAVLDFFRVGTSLESTQSYPQGTSMGALLRLNFLRASAALAALVGIVGAAIVANFASPAADPQPGLASLIFLFLVGSICAVWAALNWLLSLAAVFVVRNGRGAIDAMADAVTFCRDHLGAVFAVSSWNGLAHLVVFVAATIAASAPLGFAGVLPWRAVVLVMLLITLGYFMVVDWLYMARMAGYIYIAEMPESLPVPLPSPVPPVPAVAILNTIDRDELILSDVPRPD